MKVLQVINSLNTGGAEKLLVEAIPVYQSFGIKMDLVCLSRSKTMFWNKLEQETAGEISGLTLKSIYNPLLLFKIIPILKHYDIVHLHLFPTLYWGVLAKVISFSKVKLVYTEHSTNNRRRKYSFFRYLDRFIYLKLNKIVAITNDVRVQLKDHLRFKDEIKVINNGINIFPYQKSLNTNFSFFNKQDFKLIQVSSFREQKDQLTLIKSLQYLPKDVKLILVGDGILIEESKKMVTTLKLWDRVVFLGNRYDIPELLKYSDVVVLSSHWEGFGLAIVEGMAAGKPVIASKVKGIKEVVDKYGLLFNKGDAEELASLVNKLYENESLYQTYVNHSLARSKDFRIEKMVEQYITQYNLLLNA